jgi:hypothetical protein
MDLLLLNVSNESLSEKRKNALLTDEMITESVERKNDDYLIEMFTKCSSFLTFNIERTSDS